MEEHDEIVRIPAPEIYINLFWTLDMKPTFIALISDEDILNFLQYNFATGYFFCYFEFRIHFWGMKQKKVDNWNFSVKYLKYYSIIYWCQNWPELV